MARGDAMRVAERVGAISATRAHSHRQSVPGRQIRGHGRGNVAGTDDAPAYGWGHSTVRTPYSRSLVAHRHRATLGSRPRRAWGAWHGRHHRSTRRGAVELDDGHAIQATDPASVEGTSFIITAYSRQMKVTFINRPARTVELSRVGARCSGGEPGHRPGHQCAHRRHRFCRAVE
jgi:hypothetical protein